MSRNGHAREHADVRSRRAGRQLLRRGEADRCRDRPGVEGRREPGSVCADSSVEPDHPENRADRQRTPLFRAPAIDPRRCRPGECRGPERAGPPVRTPARAYDARPRAEPCHRVGRRLSGALSRRRHRDDLFAADAQSRRGGLRRVGRHGREPAGLRVHRAFVRHVLQRAGRVAGLPRPPRRAGRARRPGAPYLPAPRYAGGSERRMAAARRGRPGGVACGRGGAVPRECAGGDVDRAACGAGHRLAGDLFGDRRPAQRAARARAAGLPVDDARRVRDVCVAPLPGREGPHLRRSSARDAVARAESRRARWTRSRRRTAATMPVRCRASRPDGRPIRRTRWFLSRRIR